jgi:hypothetical protein
MKLSQSQRSSLLLATVSLVLVIVGLNYLDERKTTGGFDGNRAFKDLLHQVAFGPRVPGSESHADQLDWMKTNLEGMGWNVEVQESAPLGESIFNLVAKRGEGKGDPFVLLGAHYDTRPIADADPVTANQSLPIPGANDGASGVAVLMELARVIPANSEKEIWLVFFDAEDGFNIPGWGLSLGARTFVSQLNRNPQAVVIVDMVGDADLDLPIDGLSNEDLVNEIWALAADLGYENTFRNEIGYNMLDDHTPFNEQGIPAAVIIDFSYPYWHTLADDIDKVSADSLQIVGDTLLAWILSK